MTTKYLAVFVALSLGFVILPEKMEAIVPPPDGAYPNFTTAEGQNALHSLTSGAANTAVGAYSLFGTTSASFNTAHPPNVSSKTSCQWIPAAKRSCS